MIKGTQFALPMNNTILKSIILCFFLILVFNFGRYVKVALSETSSILIFDNFTDLLNY